MDFNDQVDWAEIEAGQRLLDGADGDYESEWQPVMPYGSPDDTVVLTDKYRQTRDGKVYRDSDGVRLHPGTDEYWDAINELFLGEEREAPLMEEMEEQQMTWDEAYSLFDEYINAVHGTVTVLGMTYDPARVLRKTDPGAYRGIFMDWAKSDDIDIDSLIGPDKLSE